MSWSCYDAGTEQCVKYSVKWRN